MPLDPTAKFYCQLCLRRMVEVISVAVDALNGRIVCSVRYLNGTAEVVPVESLPLHLIPVALEHLAVA